MDVSAASSAAAGIADLYNSTASEVMWRNPVAGSTLAAQEKVATEVAIYAIKEALEAAQQIIDILV